jgi:hypothetical protein
MPDNLKRRRPQDSGRININQPYEIRYWMKHFRISESELREAVQAVGTSVKDLTPRIQYQKAIKAALAFLRERR